jgi:hypothetical protein
MRNRFWLLLAPVMLLGVAACGEEVATVDEPAEPAETTPPPAATGPTTTPAPAGSQ